MSEGGVVASRAAATPGPRIVMARAAKQRERILDAAEVCFIQHGFHAASMAGIAQTADMSAGLIYRYFDSKAAIVKAIIERHLESEHYKKIGQLHTDKCIGIINGKGHELSYAPGVVEYIQEKGYSEHFGARPMLNAAMCVLGDPVAEQMLINGGRPVRGIIKHDRRSKKCSLEVAG